MIRIQPHAQKRLIERGATEAEVFEAVLRGESVDARLGRKVFRRNFVHNDEW